MFLQSVENYMKKLTTQPPTNDPTLISNMISLCADKFKMPSHKSLTLFVNRISPVGKPQKKNKSKKVMVSQSSPRGGAREAQNKGGATEAQKLFINKCLPQQMHWSHLQATTDKCLATSQAEDEKYR